MTSTNPTPRREPWVSQGAARQRRQRSHLIPLVLIAALLAGATAAAAAASERPWASWVPSGEPTVALPDPVTPATPVVPTETTAPEPTPVPAPQPVTPAPAPEPVPAPAPDPEPAAEQPSLTRDVVQVQERLRELGYLVGPADGRPGQQTTGAIMAFQRVHGLAVDGVVGPQTIAALDGPIVAPELRGGPPTRIEVDLDRQVLHVVEGGTRVVTLKVSSGNGEPYRTASGGTAIARTPVGDFVVERRIHGVRQAPLGTLYDPLYFHGGYAIHGSPSVPAGPASHGCVRITRADAAWLIARVPDGTPVQLYGGTHVFTPSR